jgi:hypothetical protein
MDRRRIEEHEARWYREKRMSQGGEKPAGDRQQVKEALNQEDETKPGMR